LKTGCNKESISWSSQSPVPNAATLPQIRKRPLPSKSFAVHYSLMNVSLEAVQFELPEVPLKEPQTKEANKHTVLISRLLVKALVLSKQF